MHLFLVSIWTILILCSKGENDFCEKYNCQCTNEQIKCNQIDKQINILEFCNKNTTKLDLSQNSLDTILFSNSTLNLKHLRLSNNKLTNIHQNQFQSLPYLTNLDLSFNQIESFHESAFQSMHLLEYLNLSNAFKSPSYQFTRELCELDNVKVLDLSYLNLESFTLECWKNAHLTELYIKHSRNSDQSWPNWFPFLGSNLKILDLTNSSIKILKSSLLNLNSLTHLILSSNSELEKSSILETLQTNNLLSRLKVLKLDNLNLNQTNLPIHTLISSLNNSNLEILDISFNNFSDDLNSFLFAQSNLKNLIEFKARNNKFKKCFNKFDLNHLEKLQILDLSFNFLQESSCLYSIKAISTLKWLDLSHNQIKINSADYKAQDFASFLTNKINLTYINLSSNLIFNLFIHFSENHGLIEKLDISNNRLRNFRVLSKTTYESIKYPFSLELEDEYEEEEEDLNEYDDYEEDMEGDVVGSSTKSDELDDNERYVIIENLDLSKNRLGSVNLQHMLQSIKNIVYLDFSFNPIQKVNGMSSDPILFKSRIEQNSTANKEILCVDSLNLANCKLQRIPHLPHACVNKLDLNNNLISGSSRLVVSNYSVYFMDYINLQANNITKLKIILNGQKFKQDYYNMQNSPLNYFYSNTNKSELNHTYLDLKMNKYFRCTCELVELMADFPYFILMNECFTNDFQMQCKKILNENRNSLTIKNLNKKLRVLFVLTCLVLILLSILIIYYMCSDFIKNLQPYDRFRLSLNRVLALVKLRKTAETSNGSSGSNSIGVQYTKLVNEATVSQVELNA